MIKRPATFGLFVRFLDELSLKFLPKDRKREYQNFHLYNHSEENTPDFFEVCIKALQLIEEQDPRRYKRVQTYLRIIHYYGLEHVNSHYTPSSKSCSIMHLGSVIDLATTIIHESTHAYLHQKGLPYRGKEEQNERIAAYEGFRFYRRYILQQEDGSINKQQIIESKYDELLEDLQHRWWSRDLKWEQVKNLLKSVFLSNYEIVSHQGTGELRSIQRYKNKKKNGLSEFYHPNGKKSAEINYADDKYHGNCRWWNKKGMLSTDANYHLGVLQGPYKHFYDNGSLEREGAYLNDKYSGLWKFYREDGSLTSEAEYENHLLNGVVAHYDEAGNIKKKFIYKNGELMESSENNI